MISTCNGKGKPQTVTHFSKHSILPPLTTRTPKDPHCFSSRLHKSTPCTHGYRCRDSLPRDSGSKSRTVLLHQSCAKCQLDNNNMPNRHHQEQYQDKAASSLSSTLMCQRGFMTVVDRPCRQHNQCQIDPLLHHKEKGLAISCLEVIIKAPL